MSQKPLQIGEFVVVGSVAYQDGKSKFIPVNTFGQKISISSIVPEPNGNTRIELDWGSQGRSRVYLHDEGKNWHRVSNFN